VLNSDLVKQQLGLGFVWLALGSEREEICDRCTDINVAVLLELNHTVHCEANMVFRFFFQTSQLCWIVLRERFPGLAHALALVAGLQVA
jgi:hypothetical protein